MFTKIRVFIRYFSIVFFLALFIPFMYIFRSTNKNVRQIMCRTIITAVGATIKLEGELDSDAKLLILNHQSMLDIIALESIHPQDLCWVSKIEITNYPYFGHINKAPRMISVDREDKAGLVKLFADVKDRLSHNRPIAMFPEGTRGKQPELLGFKPGAKMIVEKLGLRVQPIIVVDSAAFLNAHHFSLNGSGELRSGELVIIALPSFVPQKGSDWFEELRDTMQTTLEEKRIILV